MAQSDLSHFVTSASLFRPPLVTSESAWNAHTPFAAWLAEATRPTQFVELGTHRGVSYFSFCNAVERLGLATQCSAVDHWKGDDQTGRYGEEVFRSVAGFNSRYDSFSRLVRLNFDEAVEEFAPGSIDILHIDGLHTFEAVSHDFDMWADRLSRRGVVLLHDTNERRAGFGVCHLMSQLSETYSTFEFTHGHGLGVIAVGSEVTAEIRDLVNLESNSSLTRTIRDIYSALGSQFEGEARLARTEAELTDLKRHTDLTDRALDERYKELESLKESLVLRRRQVEELKEAIANLNHNTSALQYWLNWNEQRVHELESSTSWRVTAPFRLVAETAKRLSRRLRYTAPTAEDDQTEPRIERLYPAFDKHLENTTREHLRTKLYRHREIADALVSVVMPTYNRAEILSTAIASVLSQSHENLELLIVDDGSTDETPDVVADFIEDPRIRYIRVDKAGVGAARNTALEASNGQYIAYLDSDNTWDPDFLSLSLAGLHGSSTTAVFSAVRLVRDGQTIGYRGDVFDFDQCVAANYIDMNAVVHTRTPIEEGLKFDPKIRRTNDWDFILALGRHQDLTYLPFVGVDYTSESQSDQISVREAFAFRHLVQERHRQARLIDGALETFDEVLARMKFNLAIRVPCLYENRNSWGDFHFAVGMQQALVRMGHEARIYFREDEVAPRNHDVVIVLRGLAAFEPVPEAVNVIWSISHPDILDFDEMSAFDIVLVAGDAYQRMLTLATNFEVHMLRQATDRAKFFPHTDVRRKRTLLFVGNSRNIERKSVSLAITNGLPIEIHGGGWEGLVPAEAVTSTYLPNERLSAAYASAGAVLNDHWDSMRAYGYISNRVYDVLGSGGRLISDRFPELDRELGDQLATYDDEDGFVEAAKAALEDLDDSDSRQRTAIEILEWDSFDARCEVLLRLVRRELGGHTEAGAEPTRRIRHARTDSDTIRIGVIPQMPRSGHPTSSAYIRLFQPLTSDLPGPVPHVQLLNPARDLQGNPPDELDCLIVSRTALETVDGALATIEHAASAGIPLIVDTDDAFHLMDESHPQFAEYRERVAALDALIAKAADVWCSTRPLQAELRTRYGVEALLIPNSLDPRLWRRYREAATPHRPDDRVSILYFGTNTHGPDLDLVMQALDRLYVETSGAFRLTVVGVTTEAPTRKWLDVIPPPEPAPYPRFARWIRDRSMLFDLGIAPLVDNVFNRLKSDLKLLEYTAMGLPVVASAIKPYSDADHLLLSGPSEWFPTLSALIQDQNALAAEKVATREAASRLWDTRTANSIGQLQVDRIRSLIGK